MSGRWGREISATDGKIKAPTSVEGMWLVGLGILAIGSMAPAGAHGTMFNGFNAPGAVGRNSEDVERHERPRRRDQCSAWPHQARQSGCQASEELCGPGHACREEGWA